MQRKGKTSFTKAKSKLLCYLLSGALLFGNLMAFQTVPASAAEVTESNNENQETLQPKVIVSSYDELVQAIDEAGDEDIIGIDSVIQIEDDNIVLGNNIKRITIIRSARKSGIEISGKNPVINNIVFDGNGIEYKDIFYPMLDAKNGGKFTDLEIRNCHNNIWGAALKITGGTVVVSDCNFHDNVGSESAHIGVMGAEDISIYRSIFKNGHVENCAGAIGVYSKGMSALIKDCIITGNYADGYAGGIVNWGNLTISNTVIYGNTALCGADIMNYPDSEFHMDSLEQIRETYESVSIIPKEWTADYDDEVLQGVNPSGIYDKNAYLKLVYEEIPKEEEDSSGGNNDNSQIENEDKKEESDSESGGSEKDESKGDNTEPEQSKDDSSKENDDRDDSTDNKDNVGNKKDENGTGDDTVSDGGNADDSNSEQSKPEGGTAADSDSNKSNGDKENGSTEDKENQDKKENQGNQVSLDNNENKDGSSSDADKKDLEDSNNNTLDTFDENSNQTRNPSIEKPNTGNNGSASDATTSPLGGNKQPDSTVNNGNQGGTSAGNTGNNSSSNNQNQSNKPVSGVINDSTNGNVSDNTNSGSGSSLGNGNTSDNTSQSGETVSSKPENNQDNNSSSSDNGGMADITDYTQTVASNTNKDDSGNKNAVTKKKAIKKLTVTAKKGKRKITGKTIKKAVIKIGIGKKTYKVKSNVKGIFTVKLKGKAKLEKGQKIKITVSKKGYKSRTKTIKVK